MEVILLRHARVEDARRGRYLGRTDPPLSPEGEEQARRLRDTFAGCALVRLWSSPLLRARQTAALAFPRLAAEVVPDLREVDFGRWEGLTFSQVAARDPQLVDAWARFDPGFVFPGGESLGAFLARIRRVAARLRSLREDLVLVTHGGVVRGLACELLGLEPERYVLFEVEPGGFLRLRLFDNGRATLRAPAG